MSALVEQDHHLDVTTGDDKRMGGEREGAQRGGSCEEVAIRPHRGVKRHSATSVTGKIMQGEGGGVLLHEGLPERMKSPVRTAVRKGVLSGTGGSQGQNLKIQKQGRRKGNGRKWVDGPQGVQRGKK